MERRSTRESKESKQTGVYLRSFAATVELDYLVVGHVTRDLLGDGGYTVGGTVSYAARTALALGCRVGVVTSADPELNPDGALAGVLVSRSSAGMTTTFENVYTAQGRRQVIHGVAARLTPEAIPSDWQPAIVHLGPVARECDPALVDAFGDAFVGATPQGWMRRWDQEGHVTRGSWDGAETVLSRADAVVLSEEDVEGDDELVAHYAAQTRLLVLTQGEAGCTVYAAGQDRSFPAPAVRAVDATGAGDIFAAAFFVWLRRSADPWAAARFANCVAAQSVTRPGLAGTPSVEEVARCEELLKRG